MEKRATREELIEHIQDPDPARRAEAAYQMGIRGDPSFLPFLEQALDDPDSRVRWRSVQALSRMELPRKPRKVSLLLKDEAPRVRAAAATVLGRWGGEDEIPDLCSLLNDPDQEVRYRTIEALGEIRKLDRDLLERIASLLKDPDSNIRMHAALALGKCKYSPAAGLLAERLGDPHHTVRGPAAWSLGEIGDESTLAALFGALADEGEYVRIYAYQAIAAFGQRALPVLEASLQEAPPSLRPVLERLREDLEGAAGSEGGGEGT